MLRSPIALACALALAIPAAAQWPQFLGPGGRAAVDQSRVPLPFDLEKHRAFRVEVPTGHSSPVIAGERLFLTGAEGSELVMLCLDRRDGKTLWKQSVSARADEHYGHRASALAMPSGCTDGKRVFFSFGAYGLLALDVATGKTLWEKQLPLAKHDFGTGASPMLVDDLVILQRDGAPDSSIVAYAQADGAERWRVERLGCISSYATPYLWEHAGGRELVVAGTGLLTSLDPKTGAKLWEVNGLTLLVCTTPIGDAQHLYFAGWSSPGAIGAEFLESAFGEDFPVTPEDVKDPKLVFARLDANKDGMVKRSELPKGCRAADAFPAFDGNSDGAWQAEEVVPFLSRSQARGGNIAVAVKAGGKGDITKTHVAWRHEKGIPYVSSPLLFRERLWLVKAGGSLTTLDPATGAVKLDQARLPDRGEYYATPFGIDGHVLIGANSGRAFLVRAADELEIVSELDFEDELLATPACVEGVLYVRTVNALWAFRAGVRG
ncbi:MAG: PQQ-binding-like beta-propeller repeat protein [Planctomycetes bacterium]|nr:PQQ-binding-like beta-propeller repeat protein [Planctomycetota bacterium]